MAGSHVALLRGINVGRAKRIAMADLRALIEELGYRNVRTLLNSGNVVLTAGRTSAATIGQRIERAIDERLGVTARVTVLTREELDAAIDANPLASASSDPSRMLVGVLANPADRTRLEPLAAQDWTPEAMALGPRVAYLWCVDGILESPAATAVNRALGDAVTARNWATMLKLHELLHH